MSYRIIVRLILTDKVKADDVSSLLSGKITTLGKSTEHYPVAVVVNNITNATEVVGNYSFDDEAEAVKFKDYLLTQWASGTYAASIAKDSSITLHACPHSAGGTNEGKSCSERSYQLFEKL